MKKILSICILIVLLLPIFTACTGKSFSAEELKYDSIDINQYDMFTIIFFNAQGNSIGIHNFSSANHLESINSMQPEELNNVYLTSYQSTMPNFTTSENKEIVSSFEINEKEKYARITNDNYAKRVIDLEINNTYVIENTVSSFRNLPDLSNAVMDGIYRVMASETYAAYYYDGWECVYKNGNYEWESISYLTTAQVNWHSTIDSEFSLPEPNKSNKGIKYRKSGSRHQYDTMQKGFYKIKEENSIRFWERDEELSVELNDFISDSSRKYILKVNYRTEWIKTSTSVAILKYDYYSIVKINKK